MNFKEISFWVIGIATLIYCLVELAVGLAQSSLTLLSDGFHNLSDVISLYIAYWSSKASRRGRSDIMSYGWKRTEILGALTNGIFLVSLSVYITLETIPEILVPEPPPTGGIVIIIAFFGLAINTIATIVFHFTGQSHGHSHAGGGHGHSHGGGDHGHAHGEEEEEEEHGHSHSKKKKHRSEEEISLIEDFELEEKKAKKHSHSHGDDHGHSHDKKKEDHGHSHSDKEDHGHSHDKKKEDHGHSHDKKKDDHGHSHSDKEDHGHSHSEKPEKKRKIVDANVKAVCLHYFGDMVSSFFVLIMGVVIYFNPQTPENPEDWLDYVDPITSLLIVILILITTLPLSLFPFISLLLLFI